MKTQRRSCHASNKTASLSTAFTLSRLFGATAAVYAHSATDRVWTNLGNYDSTVNFAGAQGRAVFRFSDNALKGDYFDDEWFRRERPGNSRGHLVRLR